MVMVGDREGTERGDRVDTGFATARLLLVDRIGVFELQALLATISDVYYSALFLETAEALPTGSTLPDDWMPTEEDTLWVDLLTIGTPNKARLRGRAKALTHTIAIAAGMLGLSVAATQAYLNYSQAKTTWAELEKIKAETNKMRYETDLIGLQRGYFHNE